MAPRDAAASTIAGLHTEVRVCVWGGVVGGCIQRCGCGGGWCSGCGVGCCSGFCGVVCVRMYGGRLLPLYSLFSCFPAYCLVLIFIFSTHPHPTTFFTHPTTFLTPHHRSPLISFHRSPLISQVEALESLSQALSIEVRELKRERERALESRTVQGHVKNIAGYGMSAYCVFRYVRNV